MTMDGIDLGASQAQANAETFKFRGREMRRRGGVTRWCSDRRDSP